MAGASGAHGCRRTPRCGTADRGEGELDGVHEQTRVVLTSAAYVNLKQAEICKYTRNLAPANRAILLSGPADKPSSSQQLKDFA
ncbi:Spastin [Hordeum vulgare]|nr:Spastin [Hordeum vulgare]